MFKKVLIFIMILTFTLVVGTSMGDAEEGAMEGDAEEGAEMGDAEEGITEGSGTNSTDDVTEELEDAPVNATAADDEDDSQDAAPENIDADEDEMSKKSVKNFTCKVTGAILSMAESIKELSNDIKAIKSQMFEKCPGFNASAVDAIDLSDSVDALNATNLEEGADEGAGDEEEEEKETLPPIPTECDAPFQPVANSCYYFLYYPPDWKIWGDANAYCQTLGGTLAAPYRFDDLRNYLIENFSNVFWVGAKKNITKDSYEWLTGKELRKDDWKEGHPTKPAAKLCVYLESFSGYKAINYYCGEKFSFVCEKRVEVE